MTLMNRLVLLIGLLLEALLFAGVAYAQVPPVPTPAPQPQTLVGRELAAGAQILTDVSNNVNAIVLLVITVCVVVVILSIVMIVVLKAVLDAQKRSDAAQEVRDRVDRDEKLRRDKSESERVGAFTHSVNTFSVVTAGIARIETELGLLKKDKTESQQRTEARDKKYFERIDTVEDRIVDSMNTFGDRLTHEIPIALREGQVQAAQLLIDKLPEILAKGSQAVPTVIITDDPSKVKTGQLPPLPEDTDGKPADCE